MSDIKDMGFESIKSFRIDNILSGLGRWLLVNYDHNRNELKIGSHIIKITPSKVHAVLGVPMGEIPVYEKRNVGKGDVIRNKWRKQFVQNHITVKPVINKLKSYTKGGTLFKLNFLVLYNTIMGETTKCADVNHKFLSSIINEGDISSMNWCSYIITCLKKTKEGWNGIEPYNGPLTFLAVLYAHELQLKSSLENVMIPTIQYVTTDSLVDLETSIYDDDPFSQNVEVPVQFITHTEPAEGQTDEVQPQTDDGQTVVDQNVNVPLDEEDEVQPQINEGQTADQNVNILQDEEVEDLFQSTNPDSGLNLKLLVGPANAPSSSGLSATLGHCNQLKPRRDEMLHVIVIDDEDDDDDDDDDDVVILDPVQEHSVENFSSGQCGIVSVEGYKVKQSVAVILKTILKKHGDIAAECVLKTDSMRSSIHEAVCEVVMQIQTIDITERVEDLESRVSDAKAAKIDVSWLEAHIQKRKEDGEMYNSLTKMKASHLSDINAAEVNLRKRRAELEAAEERSREAKRRVEALRLVGKNLTDNFFESKAKIDSWVMDPTV
ncbi:uncharacterized protein LOC143552442 [Bidens hawaiensis]|uniref:uncharacterized protein LOC143552442 n=1 Tax=Bidens hawaiensis TaxID=980011 RepID=UPI0040491FD4